MYNEKCTMYNGACLAHFTLHTSHSSFFIKSCKKSTALKSGAKLAFIAEIHKENDKQNNVHYTLYIIHYLAKQASRSVSIASRSIF